jgi:uncharacterized membrane protein
VTASGSTTLQVTTGSNSAVGTFALTVTGSSGAVSHQTSVTLVVTRK